MKDTLTFILLATLMTGGICLAQANKANSAALEDLSSAQNELIWVSLL
jgi:hypothetical protein